MSRTKLYWDKYFLDLARYISTASKDESTKVGVVIIGPNNEVRSTGYNGLPRGANDEVPQRNERPEKYFWYEHAERNAIYNAARIGTPLSGSTIYSTLCPCMDCARAIIQSGIKRVVTTTEGNRRTDKWEEHFSRTEELLFECGVKFEYIY